jgi:multiple sugar transport system permease protein
MSKKVAEEAGLEKTGLLHTIRREFKHPIVRWAYFFMLPGVIWLFALHFYPIVRAVYLSLHQWSGYLSQPPNFIGIKNYVTILKDWELWNAVGNTFYYVLLTVPMNTFFSMVIAVMLSNIGRGRFFFRSLYFVPSVVGLVVASVIWRWCYEPLFGVLPFLFEKIGITDIYWLKETKTAMMSIAIMTIWQSMGYYTVIFMAGLTAIPQELYEVSRIDGASRIRQFLHITFPLLGPTTLFVMIYSTIKNLKIFGEIFVMTGGGPGKSTVTIGFKIYEEAFKFYNFGIANAMAMIMFLIILLVTLVQFKSLESRTRAGY